MNTHFLNLLQWLILLHGFTWEPCHPWKTLYHVPQGSSIPGKTVLPWTPAVLLDHTMNTDFRSQMQWYIVLTDSIWTPFDPWNMLNHRQQGSSTPGKTVLPQRQFNIRATCTWSNHEYTLSEPTAVDNIAAWIHLRTFPSVEDTLPRSTRFFNTWKNRSPMNASQYSSHFYWITPWIHTFWAQISDSVWKPFHLWKALYHGPQVSSTPGKSVLPRIAVSILTISTGSSRVLHTFTIYFAFPPFFNMV